MCICLNNLLHSTYPPHARIPPLRRLPIQRDRASRCMGIDIVTEWCNRCGLVTVAGMECTPGGRRKGDDSEGQEIYPLIPQHYFLFPYAYTVRVLVYSYTAKHNIYNNVSLYKYRYIMPIQVRRIFWGEKYFLKKILKNLLTSTITSVIIASQGYREPRKEREEKTS